MKYEVPGNVFGLTSWQMKPLCGIVQSALFISMMKMYFLAKVCHCGHVSEAVWCLSDKRASTLSVSQKCHSCLFHLFFSLGYKLIGSHSGVKLCRWTKVSADRLLNRYSIATLWFLCKVTFFPRYVNTFFCFFRQSMLRGRGGCYKHTFYGIESHRCMEATPSLACANKCVFCWR